MDPPSGESTPHIEAAKREINEYYMVAAFLSGLNCHIYELLMNKLHNAFRMGRGKHPKTCTNAYDLSINWKGDTGSVTIPPNDGVEFVTEGQDSNVKTIDG